MTGRESSTAAYMRENWAALVEERDRLKATLDMIAESVIVRHVCLPSSPLVQGCCETTWGCGICQGVYLGRDMPDGKGLYKHENWCPRK